MNLSYNDFELYPYRGKHKSFADDQIVIVLHASDLHFGCLSPCVHKCYISHDVPNIPNKAPTLDQFYKSFLVYRSDLTDSDKRIKLNDREPTQSFFERANNSFVCATNDQTKEDKRKPVYFYTPNGHKTIAESRKLYGELYERTSTIPGTECVLMLEALANICRHRTNESKIVVIAPDAIPGVCNDIRSTVMDETKHFGPEYCLIELLVHWNDRTKCFWNKQFTSS